MRLCFTSFGPGAAQAKRARCAALTLISITAGDGLKKSRVAGNQGGTKTNNRQIRIHDNLAKVLKSHVRFMLEPAAYLFTTPEGSPIDESNFYKREWLPMLRKL